MSSRSMALDGAAHARIGGGEKPTDGDEEECGRLIAARRDWTKLFFCLLKALRQISFVDVVAQLLPIFSMGASVFSWFCIRMARSKGDPGHHFFE